MTFRFTFYNLFGWKIKMASAFEKSLKMPFFVWNRVYFSFLEVDKYRYGTFNGKMAIFLKTIHSTLNRQAAWLVYIRYIFSFTLSRLSRRYFQYFHKITFFTEWLMPQNRYRDIGVFFFERVEKSGFKLLHTNWQLRNLTPQGKGFRVGLLEIGETATGMESCLFFLLLALSFYWLIWLPFLFPKPNVYLVWLYQVESHVQKSAQLGSFPVFL